MNARTILEAAGRGTIEVALIMALTVSAGFGLAITPAWAEVGMRLHEERGVTESQKPSDKTSYVNLAGAQFFGPPPPEKAPDDSVRFIHPDPHLLDGHRMVHIMTGPANIADGGALMFSWTFDR